ncbi:hypothetical protein AB0B96_27220, partial [Streptosporangium sp. NPDC049046]
MPPRERLRRLLETQRFQQFIIAVIVINAVTLGLETSTTTSAAPYGAGGGAEGRHPPNHKGAQNAAPPEAKRPK